MFLFCLVFAMFCARLFICALWSPAGKGLTSWLSSVVSSVSFHFPIGILGQVWYLIVSIPDLCNLITFLHLSISNAIFSSDKRDDFDFEIDFNTCNKLLTQKQGYRYHKLRKTFF